MQKQMDRILVCCTKNKPNRKIIYDSGNGDSYEMFVCEEHYRLPINQLFIVREEKLEAAQLRGRPDSTTQSRCLT